MFSIIKQFSTFNIDLYEVKIPNKKINIERTGVWKQIWYMKILEVLMPNDFRFNPGGSDYV